MTLANMWAMKKMAAGRGLVEAQAKQKQQQQQQQQLQEKSVEICV